MPRGLLFGPDLPAGPDRPDLPPKFKKTKRKTKRNVMWSKGLGKVTWSKGEMRSRKREERKQKREERLLMRAQRREEEKQRKAEMGEPVEAKVKAKRHAKRDAKTHHGTEQVDATIIKLLGRSHKSHKRMAPKSKDKKVEEVAGPKWRHGMREERNESRRVKAKPPKKTSEKMEKSKAKATVRQPKAGVQQVVPTVDVGPDYEADKLDWAEEKQSKLVPIVDVGPDFEADEGLCGSGDGAAELAWPLPIQAPLEAMPPCMEFYQVRIQQLKYRINPNTLNCLLLHWN